MTAEEPVVLKNVSHFFGKQEALHDVSVTFSSEKIIIILGRSGSGKSTLLQIVNGLIKPSAGSVSFFGSPFDYDRGHLLRRQTGYVVQGVGLFPHLTVEENILLASRIRHGSPKKDRPRMLELMSVMNLPESYRYKYPSQLSGGEQQRVGLCRALLHDPRLILMDEPLGALDPVTRHDIQREILKLQQYKKRTIVMVTHDVPEAITLADDLLVLHEGRIMQYGPKDSVVNKPANTLVSQLLSRG